ncbi:6-phosphofructo-2-kinase/fructose-2,6-bisphosphatase-like [Corticium candelabrum]|uniref:6-phosphofructo-2-kinase/fructose-2, 6-bisphosphatase-like n=1 Tax=Corticium candelabrum TaxID=121492 RepID=UPI002E25FB34|nr:6-phosphofructo-2-kinase/fructose-2,6-bisphosphatase-like [Corticium candelabrum]
MDVKAIQPDDSEEIKEVEPCGPVCRKPIQRVNQPLCIVMVGLPARGKTCICMKLARYLRWIGFKTNAVNVGEYRRRAVGVQMPSSFFRRDNKEAMALRKTVALDALSDVYKWLIKEDGDIIVFDATNTTRERRALILEYLIPKGIKVMFVESICEDAAIIEQNIKDVKVNSPDYKDLNSEVAIDDFQQRIEHYREAYEPLTVEYDGARSFIQIFDVGQRFLVNKIQGHRQTRIVYYLMNLHIRPRTIFLTRHGESMCNMTGKIGGNADLSDNGREYSKKLGEFMASMRESLPGLKVWTSYLKRTVQTAEVAGLNYEKWKALDELDAGQCDGLSYEEIQERFPEEFAKRDQDKYNYRYPMGESYRDLVQRLEPVIMELERQNNVLVICHQAVMRCIQAYFLDKDEASLPYLNCPLHTVVKLTPSAYNPELEQLKFDIGAVDTHRPKPKKVTVNRSTSEALMTVPAHY